MKKAMIFLVLVLLITLGCNVLNSEPKIGLNKYPNVFLDGRTFNAVIVMDDFSPDNELIIAQNFLEHLMSKYKIKPYTLIQYKHLNGLYNQNTIFIGTCNTNPHNKFVNLFIDCLSMEDNIGIIRLVEKENVTIISVVGKDFKDTEEAVNVLINYEKYDLSGREIQVRNDEKGDVFVRITG